MEVSNIDHEELSQKNTAPESAEILLKVIDARNRQIARFKNLGIISNSEIGVRDIETLAPLSSEARNSLNLAAKHMDLSPRAYHRVIKISRTIADLENENEIKQGHILEALQYRPKNNF